MSAHDLDLQSGLDGLRETAVQAPPAAERSPALEMASSIGNHGFSQVISRMQDGEGILPSGIAHPAVESTIAAVRGTGRPLDAGLAERFSSRLGRSVRDVQVHTGPVAASLTRAVSARAFTTGRDIFFAPDEYQPGTHNGRELIAHEVAHADQQLNAPMTGPLEVSFPGQPLELRADETAGDLLA